MQDPPSEALCSSCGLCCDGTFFVRVPLEDEEVPVMRRRALPLIEHDDKTHLPQPCRHHDGSSCRIYDDRPVACAAYRCRLLAQLEDGQVVLDAAAAKVERLRGLADSIRGALPPAADRALFKHAEAISTSIDGDTAWKRAHASLLLDMATFLHLARKDFGIRDGGSLAASSSTDVDESALP